MGLLTTLNRAINKVFGFDAPEESETSLQEQLEEYLDNQQDLLHQYMNGQQDLIPIMEMGSRLPVGFYPAYNMFTSGSATNWSTPVMETVKVFPKQEPTLLRKEWKCEFCGGVNPYEELDKDGHPQHVGHCKNCGQVKMIVQMASVA